MSVNYGSSDFSFLTNAYHNHSEKNLSQIAQCLKDSQTRVQFVTWLINDFSAEEASAEDYDWHSKVIKQLCANATIPNRSADPDEDQLIATLIAKATSQSKEVGKSLNTQLISSAVNETKFPKAYSSLLDSLLEHKSIHLVLDQAIKSKKFILVKAILNKNPAGLQEALTTPDKDGNTPIHLLAKLERPELLFHFARKQYQPFAKALTMQNKKGKTPVAFATSKGNVRSLACMMTMAKVECTEALKTKDLKGNTPLAKAAEKGRENILAFIADNNIYLFNELLDECNKKGNNPIFLAVINGHIDVLAVISGKAPDTFKNSINKKNISGDNLINLSVIHVQVNALNFLYNEWPDQVEIAIIDQNNNGDTPVSIATVEGKLDLLKFFAKIAPDKFKHGLTLQDKNGDTPITTATMDGRLDLLEFFYKKAPDEVKADLTKQNGDGNTPVFIATYNGRLDILEFFYLIAPDKFNSTLALQNQWGDTSFLLAAQSNNTAIFTFLAEKGPKELDKAMLLTNKDGVSIYSMLKKIRPHYQHLFTPMIEKNSPIRKLYKETINRKALGHAWHLSGKTELKPHATKSFFNQSFSMNLEAHHAQQWYRMISKDLDAFNAAYPDEVLDIGEIKLLQEALEYGANPTSYSLEEKLERIKAVKGIFQDTGSTRHVVTILIWGDKLVICNRADPNRESMPILAFKFDPQKLDLEALRMMEEVSTKNYKDYEQLFFKKLKTKLNLVSISREFNVASRNLFPRQTVGNCSYVSPITGVYAMMLLKEMYGVDDEGRLLGQTTSPATPKEHIQKTMQRFQTWLAFHQLQVLERNIQPLASGNPNFEPDHFIILDALFKAYLQPLDEKAQRKLETLTEVYLNSLDMQAQTQLKAYIACWTTLNKEPLL